MGNQTDDIVICFVAAHDMLCCYGIRVAIARRVIIRVTRLESTGNSISRFVYHRIVHQHDHSK